jgi:lipopolysaccharide export system protein LptA
MTGNIRVLRKNQELRCDAVEFRSNTRILQMRGNVFAVDSTHSATMFAGRADYFLNNDSVYLTINPRVHFWDPNSTDTITIFGRIITYATQSGVARSIDNVRIVGSDFVSYADTVFFFSETETAIKFGNTRIEHENSVITGDTVNILFDGNAMKEFYVVSNPLAKTVEEERGDSVFMEMHGDTLRFLLDDNRISQIISERNASVKRFSQTDPDRINRMWGERIETTIAEEGDNSLGKDVRVLSVVQGNARAIYYDAETRNESSGDTLKLFFDGDGVSRIRISGRVKGRIE